MLPIPPLSNFCSAEGERERGREARNKTNSFVVQGYATRREWFGCCLLLCMRDHQSQTWHANTTDTCPTVHFLLARHYEVRQSMLYYAIILLIQQQYF